MLWENLQSLMDIVKYISWSDMTKLERGYLIHREDAVNLTSIMADSCNTPQDPSKSTKIQNIREKWKICAQI